MGRKILLSRAWLVLIPAAFSLGWRGTAQAQLSCSQTINGTIESTDTTQTARLFRDAVVSTCAAPKTAPVTSGTGPRFYDAYTFKNALSTTQCVTVTVTQAALGFLHSVAYSDSFNPANLQQNYLADAGSSFASMVYSFNVAANASFVVVVHEVNQGGGVGKTYSVSVANCGSTTTTTLNSLTNPSVIGQAVTFTATVTAAQGGPPTGSVEFREGASVLASVPVDGAGNATFTTSSLATGAHDIRAFFLENAPFGASQSMVVTQTVNKADTTTTLSPSQNPSVVNASVTFTATVSAATPGAGTPTGTVSFFDNGALLDTITLSSGKATLTSSVLSLGDHPLVATYNGDGDFVTSSSATLTQTIAQDAVTIALSTTPMTSTWGGATDLKATVTSGTTGGTPTGTVTFMLDMSTMLGMATLNGSGEAMVSVAAGVLPPGNHTLTASYGGDTNHMPGTGSASHTVDRAATTIALASANATAVFGQDVTLTATVNESAPGDATGSVTFKEGSTTLGVATLVNGSAQLVVSSLAVGSHDLSAQYAGDTHFTGSTSSPLSQTINKASTSTTLVSSSNPGTVGASINLTATVSATAPGAGTPTGNVVFKEGTTVVGQVAVNGSGVATLPTTSLAVGAHSLTAEYAGDGNFLGSTSSVLSQSIVVAGVTVALTAMPNPSTFAQSVTFTATVSASAGGTPTGTVSFVDGSTTISSDTLNGSGVGTFSTSALGAGTHNISAVYGGDVMHGGGSSAALAQVVQKASTTTMLGSSPNPSQEGSSVTLTAQVSSSASGTITGTVTFKEGSTTLGVGTIASGTANLVASGLGLGAHALSAVYEGDANFDPSTSSLLTHTVSAVSGGIDGGTDAATDGGTDGTTDAAGDGGMNTGSSGCGCRIGTETPTPSMFVLTGGLALALLGLRKRRKRR